MPQAIKTIDQAHLLPPDTLQRLTAVVFEKWNQPFKVISVKRKLNGRYLIMVELRNGFRQELEG